MIEIDKNGQEYVITPEYPVEVMLYGLLIVNVGVVVSLYFILSRYF